MNYRPLRDYRPDLVNLIEIDETGFRPSVEELTQKYAPMVARLDDETCNKKIKLTRVRGNKKTVKSVTLTNVVRQRLNKALPKIRKLSKEFDGFSTLQFQSMMKIGGTSAQKYINILLASDIIKSDGRRWAARYRWNNERPRGLL